MTKARRVTWMVALLAVLALVASACSSGGGNNNNGNNANKGPDLSGQKLEVAGEWTGDEQKKFEKVISAFENSTGASVDYTATGDNTATILGTRVKGGNPPDIGLLPQPGLLAQFATEGALTPIESFAGSTVDQNYSPIWRELGTVDGKLYGVWYKASNKSTFWYNVSVFNTAGVQPPSTWPDLLKVAQTVSDSGVTPFSIGGGDGWPLTDWFENVYLRTAGPEMYDKLTKHEIPWTDKSVTTALQTIAQIWSKSDWLAGGTSGTLQTTFDESVANTFSDPPKAGMTYEGDFVATGLPANAKAGVDAKFFDFPSINGSQPSVVGGGDVAVLMKDSKAGEEFMKYLASPESADVWVKLGGFVSSNKNVPLGDYPDSLTEQLAKAMVSSPSIRFDMSDLEPPAFGGTPSQGEWKIMQDFLSDPSNIQGTQQALEASAKQAFASA